MTENGFIKLHRSILNWEWWTDDKTTKVFLWLLLNAQWEDSRYRGYKISKGSLVVGRKKLAKELKMSEQSIRTSLEHLKSTNEITIQSTNRFSIITITNWGKYQCLENESTNKSTNESTNNQPTTNHIKEYKEYKEYKNIRQNSNKGILSSYSPEFLNELGREVKNG